MQTKNTSGNKKSFIIIILSLSIIMLLSFILWQNYFKNKNIEIPNSPEKERNEIIMKVGRHIILPQNEIPTLATVSDPSQLKKYSFFAQATTGDKVLMYSISKKAILYRPSEDKIIEIAPIIIDSKTEENSPPKSSSTELIINKNK